MPRGDGTGPAGRGLGRGGSRGRMGGSGLGADGECVCPKLVSIPDVFGAQSPIYELNPSII